MTHDQNLAALCKALGHPARVAILKHLLQVDSCICGEIVNILPLAQSTVNNDLDPVPKNNVNFVRLGGHGMIAFYRNTGIDNRITKCFQKHSADWMVRNPDTYGFLLCRHNLRHKFRSRKNKGIGARKIFFHQTIGSV